MHGYGSVIDTKYRQDVPTESMHQREDHSHSRTLGTDYCITFTPPFVSEDFNKLNTHSFDDTLTLHIEIVVSLLCYFNKSLIFYTIFY